MRFVGLTVEREGEGVSLVGFFVRLVGNSVFRVGLSVGTNVGRGVGFGALTL